MASKRPPLLNFSYIPMQPTVGTTFWVELRTYPVLDCLDII